MITQGTQQLKGRSLQLRLILSTFVVLLLGIGGLGAGVAWQLRQIFVMQHLRSLETSANALLPQLEARPAQAQQLLDHYANSSMQLWLQQPNGTLLSAAPRQDLTLNRAILLNNAASRPEVHSLAGHQWVSLNRSLMLDRQPAQLYLAQNITPSYQQFRQTLDGLLLGMVLATGASGLLLVGLIRRSLHPLRQVDRLLERAGSARRAGCERSAQRQSAALAIDSQQIPAELGGWLQAYRTEVQRSQALAEQQQRLTRSLSHELRTSLSLVYGYLQRVRKRCNTLTECQAESIDVAISETERTIQLMNDLLELARLHDNSIELRLESVNFTEVIATAVEKATATQPQRPPIEICPAEPIVLVTDYDQLLRMVVHLLDNAIRHGKNQPIVLRLSQTPSHAVLQIIDRGCGIAAADLPHIFEPFYRAEASRCRSTGGMGLGLALVQALATALQGEIQVESTLDQGTTFTLKFPKQP